MKKEELHPIESLAKFESKRYNINKILVALSGGADSIATAYALKRIGIDIIALHCNFHLRGEESDRDEKFVMNFCASQEIPLLTIDFDVDNYILSHKGISVEMACRNLRHEWFKKKLKEREFDRIATGHNADDNIETFLLNMLRGTGTRGLRGMKSITDTIWRPLISFHRHEILDYLQKNNLSYITDSTNLQSDFRRNYLRNKIIPLLKKEWKGFDSAMDKTIRNLLNENNLVEDVINHTLPLPGKPLSAEIILSSPAPLLLLKRFLDPLGPFVKTPEEIMAAIKANKPHIRKWVLRKGIVILRNGNLFIEMSHGESCT